MNAHTKLKTTNHGARLFLICLQSRRAFRWFMIWTQSWIKGYLYDCFCFSFRMMFQSICDHNEWLVFIRSDVYWVRSSLRIPFNREYLVDPEISEINIININHCCWNINFPLFVKSFFSQWVLSVCERFFQVVTHLIQNVDLKMKLIFLLMLGYLYTVRATIIFQTDVYKRKLWKPFIS